MRILPFLALVGCHVAVNDLPRSDSGVVNEPDASTPGAVDSGMMAGPDGGILETDGGLFPGSCPDVPIKPFCTVEGWCWRDPLPLNTSVADIWAVGCSAWAAGPDGMLLERTSDGWVPRQPIIRSSFKAFAATGPTDAWLVGSTGTILHFDGSTWAAGLIRGPQLFTAAWTPQPGLLFVASEGALHRFENGVLTTMTTLPANTTIGSMAGIDARNIVALGVEGEAVNMQRNVIWRYDGNRWSKEASGKLSSVVQTQNRFFAAAESRVENGKTSGCLADITTSPPVHYCATGLSDADRPGYFEKLAVKGAGEVFAAGGGKIALFRGSTFERVFAWLPSDGTSMFTSLAWSGKELFAASPREANFAQLLRVTAGGRAVEESKRLAERGNSYHRLTAVSNEVVFAQGHRAQNGGLLAPIPGFPRYGLDISGTDSNSLWVVSAGRLVHFDGREWKENSPVSAARVLFVRALGNEVWAWDSTSNLWKLEPTGWVTRLATAAPRRQVFDVWVVDSNLSYVAGSDDVGPKVWFTNGGRFGELASLPSGVSVARIRTGATAEPLWAVTQAGGVLRYERNNWAPVMKPDWVAVEDIAVHGNSVMAVGRDGYVLRLEGGQFVSDFVGFPVSLDTIKVDSSGSVWVAGFGGILVKPGASTPRP